MSLVPYHEVIQKGGNGYDGDDGLRAYSSRSYQRGSGGIGRTVAGFFKSLAPYAKKAAISLGRNALSAGAAVAQDALDRKDIKKSLSNNLKSAGLGFTRDLIGEFAKPKNNSSQLNEEREAGLISESNKRGKRKRSKPIQPKTSIKGLTRRKKSRKSQDIFD